MQDIQEKNSDIIEFNKINPLIDVLNSKIDQCKGNEAELNKIFMELKEHTYKHNNKYLLAVCYYYMAICCFEIKNYSLCIQYIDKAIENYHHDFFLLLKSYVLNILNIPSNLPDSLRYKVSEIVIKKNNLNLDDITRIYNKYGVLIIKNIIPLSIIDKLKNNFHENSQDDKLKEVINFNNCVLPLYFLADNQQNIKDLYFSGVESKHTYHPKLFEQANLTTINELVKYLKETQPFSNLINNRNFFSDYSMLRVIDNSTHEMGASFHQDARLQRRVDNFITLWIPFTEAGQSSPTVCSIPINSRFYFPYIFNNTPVNKMLNVECFPPELLLIGNLEPGDVWIHGGYILHGTHYDSRYSKRRMSIDIRFS